MDDVPRETGFRYWPRKMVVQVAVGAILVVASHWATETRDQIRDAGLSIAGLSLARWMSKQGHRVNGANGEESNGN